MKDSEDEKVDAIVHELELFCKTPFILQCKSALKQAESEHKFRLTLYRIFHILFEFFKKLFDAKCSEKEIAKKIQEDKDMAKEILDMNHLLHSNFSGEDFSNFFHRYIPLYQDLLIYGYNNSKYKNNVQDENFIMDCCLPLKICINYSPENSPEKNNFHTYVQSCINDEAKQKIKKTNRERKQMVSGHVVPGISEECRGIIHTIEFLQRDGKTKSEIVEKLVEVKKLPPVMIEKCINCYFEENGNSKKLKKIKEIYSRYYSHYVILQDDDDNCNFLSNIPDTSCLTPKDRVIAKESCKIVIKTVGEVFIDKFSAKKLKRFLNLKLMGLVADTMTFDQLKSQAFYDECSYPFVIDTLSNKKGSINNKDIAVYYKTNEVKVDRIINKFYYEFVSKMKKNNLPLLNCVVLENQGQEKEYRKYLQKNNSPKKVINITKHIRVIERLIQESFRDYYGLIA